MRKIIVFAALMISALGMPFAAGAEEATAAVSPETKKATTKVKIVDTKAAALKTTRDQLGAKPAGSSDVVKTPMTRGERLKNYTDQVVIRLSRFLEKVERLYERADMLIAKFEQAGRDVTRARQSQALAKQALAEARAAIDALAGNFGKLTLAKFSKETTQSEIKLATEAVKAAHRAVVAVIRDLKPANRPTAPTAPTTGTTPATGQPLSN